MLKKTTLAVLGLAASSFAVAGTMGPVCTPGNVTVPCEAALWDIGVQGLYFGQIFDANKAYQHNLLPARTYDGINNEWDWGYRLEGSYHFNTGNDATATWVHYRNNSNRDGFLGVIPIPAGVTPLTSVYSLDDSTYFDQVNLVLGQHADFGLVKKMRFYGGLQYANINNESTAYFARSPALLIPSGITSVNQFEKSDFKGFGPVVGIDYSFNVTNEFSVTANGAGSLLYGTSRVDYGFVGTPAGAVLVDYYGSKKTVVASLEAKLGVNYAYAMPQGVLNLQGGYQVMNYFNALQSTGYNAPGTGVFGSSDYGLYGPYFGVKYVGNA
ncbi:Lpg1974 family pore-forming outer membrane protein [uncultured Legionella sp.]|uniref:Lpg1974 family pore-forming outer membrane protein n=1 Tax=uncultured Legionella sp. TaxID=210934 RepID=UPI00262EFF39|nr:Lpg1974 family pore-forming outer membrane protein [uncultured Legionella sp.]